MFLHSGASLHGHEYSTRQGPNTAPRPIPLLRSALRPLSDAESNSKSPTQALSSRRRSMVESPATPPRTTRPRPTSECFPRRQPVVRFVEPEPQSEPEAEWTPRQSLELKQVERTEALPDPTQVEDEATYSEASDASITPSVREGKKKKRRTPRKGTKFILAQPPPRVVKRHRRFIQIRPKLVLQLQQLTETRPKPAFDILPSSIVTGSVIAAPRLARRFPRLFRVRGSLGPNDILLASSEDYDTPVDDISDGDEDSLDKRDLLAVISPTVLQGESQTEIVLADGSVWVVGHMANGSFEFVHHSDVGAERTARWVRRKVPLENEDDYKFTFSVLDPSSRRHPILATLTPTTLEILDNYTTVSPSSSGLYPPTRSFSFDVNGSYVSPTRPGPDRTTLPVDEPTKTLITATSVWISLHLAGMAPIAKPPPPPPNRLSNSHRRTHSIVERASTFPPGLETTPTPVNVRVVSDSPAPMPTESPRPFPQRAMSTGAAFMRRRRPMVDTAGGAQAPEVVETADEVEKRGLFYTALKRAAMKLGIGRAKEAKLGQVGS